MSEKAIRQSEKMKEQTIGVEVEMNNITREKAAKIAAELSLIHILIEHIVSKGTIDEQIIQALEGKHKVQDSLISAVKVNLSKSESIRG